MAKIVDMPKLSPTMEEGRLATWHKKEGDSIQIDDLLADVETDKATMEFRSFDKGTLLKILVPAGANVVLGQPVAIFGTLGEDVSQLLLKAGAKALSGPSVQATETPKKDETVQVLPNNVLSAFAEPINSGRIKASPLVRKKAREQGLDLRYVQGSGPFGRIVERDILSVGPSVRSTAPSEKQEHKISSSVPSVNTELLAPESKPLSLMRKTIARRLTESKQQVPHFYLTVDFDVDALVQLRESINADLVALNETSEGKPVKVSVNDLLIRACALALDRVPTCNASFTPDAILYHRRVDISVAVAIDDGLVTPVVRQANKKSVLAISQEVRELAARAKAKKLKPEEMSQGTFSISNLGMFGIDAFAAVINPPEGAILAVGQTRKEPVVRGDSIVIGHKLACTLSCDHRVVDGAVGAQFLKELRALIEHPTRLLIG